MMLYFFNTSCEKNLPTKTVNKSLNINTLNTFNISDKNNDSKSGALVQTVLGSLRTNPYSVKAMTAAWRSLYDSAAPQLNATHRYVKFTPSTVEHVKLLEDLDIELYDFDLRYEVETMGDYYQELTGEQCPVLYGVVPVEFQFPAVPYQIIEDLYFDDSNPLLIGESFRLTGNLDDIQNLEGFTYDELGDINTPYIITNNNLDCDPPCVIKYHEIISTINGQAHVVFEPYCDCEPPSFVGCSPSGDVRKPYGQVRVEDTQLSDPTNPNTFLPVRHIKVIIKDNWFNSFYEETNDNGCFSFDRKFFGRVWIFINFRSSNCSIRGAKNSTVNPFKLVRSIKEYIGKAHHRQYANLLINSQMWSTRGSKAHIIWGASTANNAINVFIGYAQQEGINAPPSHLDLYLYKGDDQNGNFGATIMAGRLGEDSTATALTFGTVQVSQASLIAIPFTFSAASYLASLLPDILLNIDLSNSDELKELTYHELAHSSHYRVVDKPFWMNLVAAEIAANGHGNAGSWQAGRIALCESWAEHIGMTFADRSYGGNVSITLYGDYIEFLEHRRNEVTDHIPIGLYHDLIDGLNTSEIAGDGPWGTTSPGIIDDNVSGLTNAQLFSLIDNTTSSPTIFISKLNNSGFITGSNTTSDVNDLFSSY